MSADAQRRQDEQLNKPEQRVETSTPMVNIFINFHVLIRFNSQFPKRKHYKHIWHSWTSKKTLKKLF